MNDEQLKSLSEFSTCTLSDALDAVGIHGQCIGLMPVWPVKRMSGRAFTVGMAPAAHVAGSTGDFLDEVTPGSVVAIDNRGILDCTVWGDLMTRVATRRGLAGTVINGVCRDTVEGEQFGYPMFSLGRHTRSGKLRVQAETFNQPVTIGGVRVEPADVIVGDRDGVVVVPQAVERLVLAEARRIEGAEDRIRQLIDSGATLRYARQQVGYLELTARRDGNLET